MPHVKLEFSQGLEAQHDMQALCRTVFDTLAAIPDFDPPTIKIRATPVPYSYIGTQPQSFVHATVLLMDGRDAATRKTVTHAVLNTLNTALPDVGSLTVQDVEMDRASYAKRVL